jgi:ribosomal RNA-processing protein 36
MAISESLNKRIRARHDEDEDDLATESSSNEVVDEQSDEDAEMSDNASDDSENDDDDDEKEDSMSESAGDENEAVQSEMRQISFGALAKAQDSIGKRKRGQSDSTKNSEDTKVSTLDDIRERLRKAREEKQQGSKNPNSTYAENSTKRPPARSSKHAPKVQSSKYQVTRRRIVVEPPNAVKARDPRFDPTVAGTRHNEAAANHAYSFLDEYRSSEIKQLKEQMAHTKDAALRDKLKRAITSAKDRQRAMDNKKHEREVLGEHKKKERQLLREGKKSQPYFLKNSELKREVLKKKYESMGSKERAKALERRRKKVASKEKKDLPWARRGMENADGS